MAAVAGQLFERRVSDQHALVSGCVLLLGGVGLLALALAAESLAILIASAVVVGLGQGLALGAALAAINQRAPVHQRGETASSFFGVMYVGLSLPVIGLGAIVQVTDLKTAGIVFSAAVAVVVMVVLASIERAARLPAEPVIRARAQQPL